MRRIIAISIAFAFVPFVAFADDVGGGESIVIQRDAVVVEEVVSAPPPAYVELQSTANGAGIAAPIARDILLEVQRRHAAAPSAGRKSVGLKPTAAENEG